MVNVILTLRIVQAVLAIIVLGLAAYVVNFYNTHGYTLDSANFLVFNVCACLVFVAFFPSLKIGPCSESSCIIALGRVEV